jgi:hypothetical protein
MTTAVCVCCGATKLGELTPRLECKFDPRENEDKAPAMVFADHFFFVLRRYKLGIGVHQVTLTVAYSDELVKETSSTISSSQTAIRVK